jgi:NAD(P)-dependent dehydrogenase (short-subunit alcohol dehydrogenase family)
MRILIVGGTGTIGSAVAEALKSRHELVVASRRSPERVDITDAQSIRALYERVGAVDAVISAAGNAAYKPLRQLADADFAMSLGNKLMGQVNLIRFGLDAVRDNGSFTLTSGVLAQEPAPGSSALSLVNAALEGFVRAAALDLGRGRRINVVSPPWVSETLRALRMDPSGGMPAQDVARAYVASVEGSETGRVIDARKV